MDRFGDPVGRWRTEGWALLDGLIPAEAVSAAVAEIDGRDLDPPTNRGPLRRPDADAEPGAETPTFREEQFSGTVLFPIPDAPKLNRLFVQPDLVAFAEQALGTADIRIYQSRLWSKFGERANYEQPLHRDTNHSLVPTRSSPGWWFLECFVYLSDVGDRNGAPRLVPRSASVGEPAARRSATRDGEAFLYDAEISAPGGAGSVLVYRSDVWHRGTDIDEGAERHVLVVAFKPAGLDWIGFDSHAPLINNADFVNFACECTPHELALFGVPLPGHPYWTAETVEAMAHIYPGLDLDPWRLSLP